MPRSKHLHSFAFEYSPELSAALSKAMESRKRSRNAQLEEWLWRIGDIKEAARELGITKPERKRPGRPKTPQG